MDIEKIKQKTLHKLLDQYEKSKTFTGNNQVNQSFSKRVGELFPKYVDDSEYDFFCYCIYIIYCKYCFLSMLSTRS